MLNENNIRDYLAENLHELENGLSADPPSSSLDRRKGSFLALG